MNIQRLSDVEKDVAKREMRDTHTHAHSQIIPWREIYIIIRKNFQHPGRHKKLGVIVTISQFNNAISTNDTAPPRSQPLGLRHRKALSLRLLTQEIVY